MSPAHGPGTLQSTSKDVCRCSGRLMSVDCGSRERMVCGPTRCQYVHGNFRQGNNSECDSHVVKPISNSRGAPVLSAVLPSWPPIVHLPLCTSSQATFLLTDPHLAARPHIVVTATFACICAHEAAVTTITQRNRGKPWHCSHGQNHALATSSPQGNTLMERSFLRCQRHAGAARPQKLSRSVTSSEIVTATGAGCCFQGVGGLY